jgi:hypothetical protein
MKEKLLRLYLDILQHIELFISYIDTILDNKICYIYERLAAIRKADVIKKKISR